MWKAIKYFKHYEISDRGEVRNKHTGKKIKVNYYTTFPKVMLYKNGKYYSYNLSYLVASAFLKNPLCFKYVLHLDGNLKNCTAVNLFFVKENPYKHIQAQIKNIKCIEKNKIYTNVKDAAADNFISASSVYRSIQEGKEVCNLHFKVVAPEGETK